MPGSCKEADLLWPEKCILTNKTTSTHSNGSQTTPQKGLLRYMQDLGQEQAEESEREGGWKFAIESLRETIDRSLENLHDSLKKIEADLGKPVEFQAVRIDSLEKKMAAKDTELQECVAKVRDLERSLENSVGSQNLSWRGCHGEITSESWKSPKLKMRTLKNWLKPRFCHLFHIFQMLRLRTRTVCVKDRMTVTLTSWCGVCHTNTRPSWWKTDSLAL